MQALVVHLRPAGRQIAEVELIITFIQRDLRQVKGRLAADRRQIRSFRQRERRALVLDHRDRASAAALGDSGEIIK